MNDPEDNTTVPPTEPGPNPVIGTPRLPHIEPPPQVIHSLGNARPGEANPATQQAGAPPQVAAADTAGLLADRELAEEDIAAGRAAGNPELAPGRPGDSLAYEDAGSNVGPQDMQHEGRPNFTGISDDTHIEIIEGLKDGQAVVSGGYKAISRELEDGKKVRLEDLEAKKKNEKKKKQE